jgi:hypothetical protein
LIVGVIIDLEELALAVEVVESLGVDAMATRVLGLEFRAHVCGSRKIFELSKIRIGFGSPSDLFVWWFSRRRCGKFEL